MAGYSGKPLAQKLGIKPDEQVFAVGSPENYEQLLDPLPEGATIVDRPSEADRAPESLAFVHLFAVWRTDLEERLAQWQPLLAKDGTLWTSWPKKSARVETDLNENLIREIGLAAGLVDVKICAVDPTWSGLKFVYRLRDR